MNPEPVECCYCGEPYNPAKSDADRPRDYCRAECQRLAFSPEGRRS